MRTPRLRRSERGQSSVEYMLLLTSMVFVAQLVGHFLIKYVPGITERLIDRMLTAALTLASPY